MKAFQRSIELLFMVGGAVSVIYGLALLSAPLALVVAGALVVWVSLPD